MQALKTFFWQMREILKKYINFLFSKISVPRNTL